MESISGSVEPLAMFSVLEQFATIKPKCHITRMDWKDGISLSRYRKTAESLLKTSPTRQSREPNDLLDVQKCFCICVCQMNTNSQSIASDKCICLLWLCRQFLFSAVQEKNSALDLAGSYRLAPGQHII